MGKKMINEIDISKCEFCYSGKYCHIYSGTADSRWLCEENEDCQIKKLLLQLKRKEQKLAKIKEILEIHKDNKCVTCQKFDECFEQPSCDNVLLQIIEE